MSEPTTITPPAYEAMDAKDRQAKLGFVVKLASGERLYLNYPDVHLLRLSPDETVLAVFCYGINIVMWGRNLGHVADALHGKYLAWAQAFDAARWSAPTDAQAPYIARVEVYAKKDEGGPQVDRAAAGVEGSRARH